jgi:hypothetical protein
MVICFFPLDMAEDFDVSMVLDAPAPTEKKPKPTKPRSRKKKSEVKPTTEAIAHHVETSTRTLETFSALADASVGAVPVLKKPKKPAFNTVRGIAGARSVASKIASETHSIEAPRTTARKRYDTAKIEDLGTYHILDEKKCSIWIPPTSTDPVSVEQARVAGVKLVESVLGSSEDPEGFKDKMTNPFRFMESYFKPVDPFARIWDNGQVQFGFTDAMAKSVPAIRRALQQSVMCEAGDTENSRCVRESHCIFGYLCRVLNHPLYPKGDAVGLSFEVTPHDEKDMIVAHSQGPPVPRRYLCIFCRRLDNHYNALRMIAKQERLETFPNTDRCYVEEPGEYFREDTIVSPRDGPVTWGPCVIFSVAHFKPIILADGRAGFVDTLPVF